MKGRAARILVRHLVVDVAAAVDGRSVYRLMTIRCGVSLHDIVVVVEGIATASSPAVGERVAACRSHYLHKKTVRFDNSV